MKTRVGHLNYINNKDRKSKESENYHFIWAKSKITGALIPLMLTDIELSNAILRANKNKEDIVEQSFISKILD